MQCIDLSQTTEGSLGGHQLNLMPPVRLVMLPLHGFIWLCSVRLKISPNTSESCSSRLGITWLSARAFEIEMLRSWLKAHCGWEQRRGRAYQTGPAAERHTQRAGMEINVTAIMIFLLHLTVFPSPLRKRGALGFVLASLSVQKD